MVVLAPTAATATPSPIDPALQGLPQANVRSAGTFSEHEFQNIPNVPVFAEHETIAQDGRKLRFTRNELQAVVERCNRRITESGDYAALSLGHTPSPDDPHGQMPDVVGFAGPFRLGQIGQPGQRQRYAILADFHVFREDAAKIKKYPRRSPELWLEDKYEEMFLDPIALLSSEAPRLDMGMLYSARRHGQLIEKYTAVAPAAGNVFIPSDRYAADPNPTNQSGGGPMLQPEDVSQIIDALNQTDVFQFVRGLMNEQAGPNTTVPEPLEGPPAPGAAPPANPVSSLSPEAPPAVPLSPPDGLAAPGPGPGPGPPPNAAPAAGPPSVPGPAEEPKRYAADGDKANATGEYQTADEKEDMGGSKNDSGPTDEFVPPTPAKKKNYAACDELDDDEFEEYSRQRQRRRKGGKISYAADGDVDGENAEKPTEASVEPADPGPKGEGSNDDTDGEAAGEYQKATPPKKFARREADQKVELYQLQDQLTEVRKQLDVERGARVDAERYSSLAERRQYYVFELDDEVERCKYSKMSDEQFNDHLGVIETNYRPGPYGHSLPTHTNGTAEAAANAPDRPGSGVHREKYNAEHSDRARTICEAKATAGEEVDYAAVLASLQAGEKVEI